MTPFDAFTLGWVLGILTAVIVMKIGPQLAEQRRKDIGHEE